MKTGYVAGIGELLWDMLPEGRRLGGAPANFAFHVSQFGLDSVIVSAVGDDEEGDSAICELEQLASGNGSLSLMIERVGFPTGTVGVEVDSAGIPKYDIRMPVAWDNIPFTSKLRRLAAETKAVCFGTLAQRSPVSSRTIYDFVSAVPCEEGRYRVFDINLRQDFYNNDVILRSLELCNIFKINDEELDVVGDMLSLCGTTPQEKCKELVARYGLQYLILTCGASGSYIFTSAGEVSFLETPEVKVADTVGAGDSFTAAFVSSLLLGKSFREAHRAAVDLAAYVCSHNGAMVKVCHDVK